MNTYRIKTHTVSVEMKTGPDIANLTNELRAALGRSGIHTGVMNVFVIGSTGSVTAIEYEPGVVEDLKRAITSLAPPDQVYEHEMAWHDGNGHSHVQAALLGPSISIPVREGKLGLGTWQQVVAVNHDKGPRRRRIEITISGV